jgi:hypothetical protein
VAGAGAWSGSDIPECSCRQRRVSDFADDGHHRERRRRCF